MKIRKILVFFLCFVSLSLVTVTSCPYFKQRERDPSKHAAAHASHAAAAHFNHDFLLRNSQEISSNSDSFSYDSNDSSSRRSLASSLGPPVCSLSPLTRATSQTSMCSLYHEIQTEFLSIPLSTRQLLYPPLLRVSFHDAAEANRRLIHHHQEDQMVV